MMTLIQPRYVVAAQIAGNLHNPLYPACGRVKRPASKPTTAIELLFLWRDCCLPGMRFSNENGPPAGELATRFIWSKQEGQPGLF
jgi:hypothetical protein